jgi:hypothetical protein
VALRGVGCLVVIVVVVPILAPCDPCSAAGLGHCAVVAWVRRSASARTGMARGDWKGGVGFAAWQWPVRVHGVAMTRTPLAGCCGFGALSPKAKEGGSKLFWHRQGSCRGADPYQAESFRLEGRGGEGRGERKVASVLYATWPCLHAA